VASLVENLVSKIVLIAVESVFKILLVTAVELISEVTFALVSVEVSFDFGKVIPSISAVDETYIFNSK